MIRCVVVGACAFALSALAAASAAAQDAQTVTAIGSAQVVVKPRNRTVNASIADAVRAASIRAMPLAIAHAREEADRIASAVGLVLGPIVSVNENVLPSSPYGPYLVPSFGPFGPGRYCGTVTRVSAKRDASGRRIVRRVKEHRCSAPPFASATVAVTFSATPPPPPPPSPPSCVVQNGVAVCATHG
jgi:uncharacterized protein DUF541